MGSKSHNLEFERASCRLIDKQEKQIAALTAEVRALKEDARDAEAEIRRLGNVAASSYYDSEEGMWKNRKVRNGVAKEGT